MDRTRFSIIQSVIVLHPAQGIGSPNFFMAHPERLLWTEAPVPGSIGAGQGQWKSTSLPFLFFFAALPFFPPTFSWLTPNACCGRKRLYLAPLGRGRDSGSPRAFLFSSSLLLFPFFPQLFHGSPRTLVVDGSACTWLHWGGAGTVEVHEPSFSLLLCCSSLFSPNFFMAHPERLLWTEAPVPGSIGAGQGQWKSTSLPFLFFFAALPLFPPTFSWLTPNACCGRKRLYLAPLGRGRDSGSPRACLFSSSLLLFPFFPQLFHGSPRTLVVDGSACTWLHWGGAGTVEVHEPSFSLLLCCSSLFSPNFFMAHPERLLWTEAPVPGSIGAGQGQWKSTSLPFLFFFAALPFFPPTFSWLTPNACCGRKRLYLAPLGRGRDSGSPRACLFSSSLLLFPFFPQLFHGSPRTLVVDGSACTWLHWGGAGTVEVHEPSFSLLLCCSSLFPPNFFMAHPERLLWTEAPVPGSIGAGQGQWKSTSLPFLFFFAALPFFPQLFHGSPRTLVVDGSACTWLHWGGAGTVEVHEPSFSLLLCCSSLFPPNFFMAHPERLLWTEAPVPGSIGAGQGQWKSTSLPFLFFFAALPFFPPTFSWLTPNACCGRKRLYLAPLGRGRDSGSPRAFLFSSSLLLFPFSPQLFHGSPRTLVVDGSACTWLHWGGAGTVEVHEPSFSLLLCCSSPFSPNFFMTHPECLLWTEAPVPGSIGEYLEYN